MSELSIIIPVYNCEKNIHKLLSSIVKQNTFNTEVVIVNDGSTDSTLEICKQYAETYGSIHLISQENSGPAKARNVGIMNAKEDNYIWFIDADDEISEHALQIINSEIHTNYELICFGYKKVLCNSVEKVQSIVKFDESMFSKEDITIEMLQKELYNVVWNKVIKKSVIIENNILFEELPLIEDVDWVNKIMKLNLKIKSLKEILYVYTIVEGRTNTVSTKFYECRLEMGIKLNHDYTETMKEIGVLQDVESIINNIFLTNIYSTLMQYYENKLEKEEKLNKDFMTIFKTNSIMTKIKRSKPKSLGTKIFRLLILCKSKYVVKKYISLRVK